LEDRYDCAPFSPLRFVLEIMHELSVRGAVAVLSFEEFALHVQTSSPDDGIASVVDRVLSYRAAREAARGKVRAFDRDQYEAIAAQIDRQASTLDDYADLSFRYL
jgi:hypothetical protein